MTKKTKKTATEENKVETKLRKQIATIRRQGDSAQKLIQSTAIECAKFAMDNNGDTTLMTELYHALPAMVRRASFKAWVEAYFPMNFREIKAKGNGGSHKVFKKDKKAYEALGEGDAVATLYNFRGAEETPFYKFEAPKGDNEADPMTAEQLKEKVLSYLDRQIKKTNDPAVIDFAKAMREKLAA